MHPLGSDGKKRGFVMQLSKNHQNGQVVIKQPSWRKLPPKGPNPKKAARTGMAMGWLPNWKNPIKFSGYFLGYRVPGRAHVSADFFGKTWAKILCRRDEYTPKSYVLRFHFAKILPLKTCTCGPFIERLGDCGCANAKRSRKFTPTPVSS